MITPSPTYSHHYEPSRVTIITGSKNPFIRFFENIVEAIKGFFEAIGELFTGNSKSLTNRDVTVIDRAISRRKNKIAQRKLVETRIITKNSAQQQITKTAKPEIEDPIIREFHLVVTSSAKKTAKEFHEKSGAPSPWIKLFLGKPGQSDKDFHDEFKVAIEILIENNAEIITDYLVRRLIDITNNIDTYSASFELLGLIRDHVNALISANMRKDEFTSAMEKLLAESAKENINALQKLKEYQDCFYDGNESEATEIDYDFIKEKIKSESENVEQEEYSTHKICHPAIGFIINNFNLTSKEVEQLENDIYGKLVEQLIPILLPTHTQIDENGKETEINGLNHLLEQLTLPDMFKNWREIIETIANTSIRQFIGEIIRENILRFSEEKTKNMLMANHIFPTLQSQMIKAKSQSILMSNLGKLGPLLLEKSRLDDLVSELYKLSGYEADVVTKEEHSCSVKEYLSRIADNLIEMKTRDGDKFDLVKQINQMINNQQDYNVTTYGEITWDLVKKLGKFDFSGFTGFVGNIEMVQTLIKESISQSMTNAMAKLHEDPKSYVKVLTELMRHKSDKVVTSSTTSNANTNISLSESKDRYIRSLEKTAKITRDLLNHTVDEGVPWYLRYYVKRDVVGSDHKKIEGVISNIYIKVFGNPLIMQNFLIQGVHTIFSTFADAGQQIIPTVQTVVEEDDEDSSVFLEANSDS